MFRSEICMKKIEKINMSFRPVKQNEDEVWGLASREDMLGTLDKINEIIEAVTELQQDIKSIQENKRS